MVLIRSERGITYLSTHLTAVTATPRLGRSSVSGGGSWFRHGASYWYIYIYIYIYGDNQCHLVGKPRHASLGQGRYGSINAGIS